MQIRSTQRYPLRNASPERTRHPERRPRDPTIINSNKQWQSGLRGTIKPREASKSPSRSLSPSSRKEFRQGQAVLYDEIEQLRRENAGLKAREMCNREEMQALANHCQSLEQSRDSERDRWDHEHQHAITNKGQTEAELSQVVAQRDMLWKSHSTLQSAVERLETVVQQHQEVIEKLRSRNLELESVANTPRAPSVAASPSPPTQKAPNPEMSAVMQQLMQLLHSEPRRVITELCAFPVAAAVRLLQKDVLPLLPIDAAVCDRIQLQLLDVATAESLNRVKVQLLASLPADN